MKNPLQHRVILFVLMTITSIHSYSQAGIASHYSGDIGIENDPNVLFTEMFEEANIAAVIANWTNHENATQMALVPDLPSGSSGRSSIRFTTIGRSISTVYLYKLLSPGIQDSLFFRFYIKYNNKGSFHHTGGGIGGYNPPSNWPVGRAGIRPSGSDRFNFRIEPRDAGPGPQTTARLDYYTYWMGMHGNTASNTYYGNGFINDTSVRITMNDWTCIEVMVKLNNPVTASNGELSLWINGKKVSHLKQGSPTGSWRGDEFTPGTGAPFDGFQWRNDANLNINWLSLAHYVTMDAIGQHNSIYYDHVVAAKSYIGPIAK